MNLHIGHIAKVDIAAKPSPEGRLLGYVSVTKGLCVVDEKSIIGMSDTLDEEAKACEGRFQKMFPDARVAMVVSVDA